MTDQLIHDVLVVLILVALLVYGGAILLRALRRSRPDLAIGGPIAAAIGIRIIATAGVSLTSLAVSLRGGDEVTFIQNATSIRQLPIGAQEWVDSLTGKLHEFVLAVSFVTFDSPDFGLRILELGIAVGGLVFLATAVYDLAGPRAATIAAWLLALEPANIFFSGVIHKEPLMLLAAGLVAFGGARIWTQGSLTSLLPMTFGCLIAVATRPYAGWFLIAAAAAITLHAGIRAREREEMRATALIALVILLAGLTAPTILEASTEESLKQNLHVSQTANATDESNLALEEVDFSTREQIVLNLPKRIRDVLLRPYPWQLSNTSQQLGAFGALIMVVVLVGLARAAYVYRGEVMARAGPLLYVGLFLLVAYSLSTGNAGTGFRYRTHVLALAICVLVAVRWHREEVPAEEAAEEREATPALAASG